MNNNTHMARCIRSITVSKQRDHRRGAENLTVEVELNQRAVLGACIQVSDMELYCRRPTAADYDYFAQHRRREIAHSLSRAFIAEIEDAVGRLDAATLVGEEVTLRRSR